MRILRHPGRIRGATAALLGLGLALAAPSTATAATGTTATTAAPAGAAASRHADGGTHRSPHTAGLNYAKAPASTIMCAKVAAKAGFSFNRTVATSLGQEPQIIVAIAVAMAESSCSPSAVNVNSGGSRDRGLWQMNSYYHSEVSDACAFQIQCNANSAWNISNHGTDWKPWTTFASGAWKTYLTAARSAISGGFTFQLIDSAAGTCLDADSTNHASGAPIRQWACDASDHYQQWTVVSSVGAPPILRNLGTGTCLAWDGTKTGNTQPIIQWACDTADANQQFGFLGSGRMNVDGQAQALIQNSHAATCLAAQGTNHANGAPVWQWSCGASDGYQMWD